MYMYLYLRLTLPVATSKFVCILKMTDKAKIKELEKELYRERRGCADFVEEQRRIRKESETRKYEIL